MVLFSPPYGSHFLEAESLFLGGSAFAPGLVSFWGDYALWGYAAGEMSFTCSGSLQPWKARLPSSTSVGSSLAFHAAVIGASLQSPQRNLSDRMHFVKRGSMRRVSLKPSS